MKQRISTSQLSELTPSQQEKLREWWKPEIGDYTTGESVKMGLVVIPEQAKDVNQLPLLSIGQCIELLEERTQHGEWWESILYDEFYNGGGVFKYYTGELIDALWEAVKQIL